MFTSIIGDKLKQVEIYHGGSINHWVGGLIHITVQKRYDLQYLTIHLTCYMKAPTEP